MTWAEKIKDLLVKVTLYQYGKYSAEKLDRELTEFLKAAEGPLCEAIRRNGGVCYKELIEEGFTQEEALEEIESQAENFEMLDKTGKIIADLLRLSIEFRNLDKMTLSNKILLFDKVVHAEHAAGAFKEYLAEEKSIFGVDITKIKEEADKEVEEILEGKKEAPDPPRIDNTTAIVKLAGIEEKIKKELEKKDSPYAKYVFAMAEFLELPVEVVAKSEPVIKYYLRFKSD